MLNELIRYGTRHHLFFPRGGEGKTMPQLNPTVSYSHAREGKRTWSLHEPLWLFKFRQNVLCYAGKHRCASRDHSHFGQEDKSAYPDYWHRGMDGNRTCSYCGSIHPTDLDKIFEKAKEDDRYRVTGSSKNYKFYIRQPNVSNAGQGAIKFYSWHRDQETINVTDS